MKKTRQTRHTIFIYCEGKTDHLFVQYLKALYLLRGTKKITLKKGTGGKLSTFISETVGIAQVRDYDEKYIVLDSNGRKEEELRTEQTKAENHKIKLIWQRPCLEGVFLQILKGSNFSKEKSEKCKVNFYREYISNTPLDETLLKKLFPKSLLDKKREKIKELNQLIQLMEEQPEQVNK